MTTGAETDGTGSSSLMEKVSARSSDFLDKLSWSFRRGDSSKAAETSAAAAGAAGAGEGTKESNDTNEKDNDKEETAQTAFSPSVRQSSTARTTDPNFVQKHKKWLLLALGLLLLLIIILSATLAGNKDDNPVAVAKVILETESPTPSPVASPTASPTLAPSTNQPTTSQPTLAPTGQPSFLRTTAPSTAPPTQAPSTAAPTLAPSTREPTAAPTAGPTLTFRIPCSDDEPCEDPMVCVLGFCAESLLPDRRTCRRSTDCESNRCGLSEFSSTAHTICCVDGKASVHPVEWSLTHQIVCRNLQQGQLCPDDAACASGACVEGVCVATRQADWAHCDSHRDCESQVCGKQAFTPSASSHCCQQGDGILLDVPWGFAHETMCAHQPAGLECGDDRTCESGVCVHGICASQALELGQDCDKDTSCQAGSYCGRQEMDTEAPRICCSKVIRADPLVWANGNEYICGDIEVGGKCLEDDALCQSHVCRLGTCANGTVAEYLTCDSDLDCTNGRCGYSSATDETQICCPEGKAIVQSVSWSPTFEWICSTAAGSSVQVVGDAVDGSDCSRDLDCANRACGRSAFAQNANDMCCPDGGKYRLGVPWDYNLHLFCGGLVLGTVCGDDRMCDSGLCVLGVCASEPLQEAEACGKDSDCVTRTCSGGSFVPDANQMCCPGGERYKLEVPWGYGEEWFCGNLDVGTACGVNSMCSSGFCIGGVCVTEPLGIGEPCQEDNDCVNLACAKTSYASNPDDAPMACCPDGDTILLGFPDNGFLPDTYCDNVIRPIRSNCIRGDQCESGTCLENSCT